MTSSIWVYLTGLIGMGLYGTRQIIQWYKSEKAGIVITPGLYWVMSSLGAILLYLYGWMRKDISIIFGESVSYYIYMWNISVMGLYKRTPRMIITLQALFPVLIITLMANDFPAFKKEFLQNPDIPPGLLFMGLSGQFIYEIRSVYQLIYSYRLKKSFLPLGHWILAVAGAIIIIIYGVIRHDWVLVIGQFGIVLSIRNIMIYLKDPQKKKYSNA